MSPWMGVKRERAHPLDRREQKRVSKQADRQGIRRGCGLLPCACVRIVPTELGEALGEGLEGAGLLHGVVAGGQHLLWFDRFIWGGRRVCVFLHVSDVGGEV